MDREEKTYSFVVEADEALQYLGHHWCPRCDVLGLSIQPQLCEVLEDTESKPATNQRDESIRSRSLMWQSTHGSSLSATCGLAA